MDREEEIRDIKEIINNMEKENAHYYVEENGHLCSKEAFADCVAIAEVLYNAGYRKADDVRRETAREILKEFWNIQFGQRELDNVCIRLAEKYGVEVE